ncbi:MAG TPA: tRNA 2-thiouridine(34) synthase MnmA [Candidatus Paceibacterota bacterium]
MRNAKSSEQSRRVVFVGLSGGVDSAVSAALLLKQGFEVVGVFIKTWHPDFLECNEEEERRDAMRVAAYLDIPFLTFDLEDVYKKEVADYMILQYKAGRTPNPDVMCNKYVKFGAFLKRALAMGADFVATGHYAGIPPLLDKEGFRGGNSKKNHLAQINLGTPPPKGGEGFKLYKSIDSSKDQSYFLWTLKQEQLSKILFPVGGLLKSDVRKLGKKFNLPVAEKKDSQGICFLGAVDLKEFLKHYIKEKKGKVLNIKGEVIGHHNGVVFSTLGERHGFTITKKGPNDGPYYIVGKDVKKNILTVSQKVNFPRQDLGKNEYKLENTNWISEIPNETKDYTAQIRYHGELLDCKIKIIGKTKVEIIFEKPVLVASGQSVVLYDGDVCLGGGVII